MTGIEDERRVEEFDPVYRMMEISLPDNTTESSIYRVACLVSKYLYKNPQIEKNGFSNFGTRNMVDIEVDEDADLNPNIELKPGEEKLRKFIKRVIPDADTPHKWLFASLDDQIEY